MSLKPYWSDDQVTLYLGDCAEVMAEIEPDSVDAIVTDPPYGLEFMGVAWDTMRDDGKPRVRNEWKDFGSREHARHPSEWAAIKRRKNVAFYDFSLRWAAEALRVLKPGGHVLAFGGTRTWHRLACAVEDAGFEIRDSTADLTGREAPGLMWLYGSGFPKSLDVSKAIDKSASAEREVLAEGRPLKRMIPGADQNRTGSWIKDNGREFVPTVTAPATEEAAQWDGWGTALKPAWEPIVVGRKPLAGTVAANVLAHGTGALNIDGCRVGSGGQLRWESPRGMGFSGGTDNGPARALESDSGRWPPNILLGPDAAAEIDRQSGSRPAGSRVTGHEPSARMGANGIYGDAGSSRPEFAGYGDSGGASRFFPVFRYEAKAAASERPRGEDGTAHPTVKPVDLMAWLVRLVTPPGGLVLDPFGGSGTTAEACIVEGFRSVLIEKDPAYAELIRKRLRKDIQPAMFGVA